MPQAWLSYTHTHTISLVQNQLNIQGNHNKDLQFYSCFKQVLVQLRKEHFNFVPDHTKNKNDSQSILHVQKTSSSGILL